MLLCVTNTQIPCTWEAKEEQKVILFTVLNIRRKGWSKAPWYKFYLYFFHVFCVICPVDRKNQQVSSSKGGKSGGGKNSSANNENAKDLFEIGEWAQNDVTMERVGKSVLVYSYAKDGQSSRGEREDDKISVVSAGQTFRVVLQRFHYEEKKGGPRSNIFPPDMDFIPPFTVVEVILGAGHTKSFEEGFGVTLARIRPCPFTLYSMMGPLGLELLPSTHESSVSSAETFVQTCPGLVKTLETKNTGFYARVARGAYITKYSEDNFRLVGPKEDANDPLSRHLDVVEGGGVFAITVSKADVLRFTNAVEPEDEENALIYAQCLLDLAASAGALTCYVVHNEYLMRRDPNGIPYTGVPLIDSNKLLESVSLPYLLQSGASKTKFLLPFSVVNMDSPFLAVDCACIDNNSAGDPDAKPLPCPDLVFASENAPVRYAYPLSLGDATDEEFMRILFVPKSASAGRLACGGSASGGGSGMLERQDYRLLKRARLAS